MKLFARMIERKEEGKMKYLVFLTLNILSSDNTTTCINNPSSVDNAKECVVNLDLNMFSS